MQVENADSRSRSRFVDFIENTTTFACMRVLIYIIMTVKIIFIITGVVILLIKRNEECKVPLKIFIGMFIGFSTVQTGLFALKHREIMNTREIPEYTENNEISLLSNLIDALLLFWYLAGLHWSQECVSCKITNPVLYGLTNTIIYLGLIQIITPLIALIVLVIFISCLNPKIPVVEFKKSDINEEDAKCSICLEKYIEGVSLKYLPCKHHFHSSCIDGWFNVDELCPLCMKPLNLFHEMIDNPPI